MAPIPHPHQTPRCDAVGVRFHHGEDCPVTSIWSGAQPEWCWALDAAVSASSEAGACARRRALTRGGLGARSSARRAAMRSPLLSLVALLLVSVGDGSLIVTRPVRQFGFFRERHRHASARLLSALLAAMLAPLLGRSSWPSGRFDLPSSFAVLVPGPLQRNFVMHPRVGEAPVRLGFRTATTMPSSPRSRSHESQHNRSESSSGPTPPARAGSAPPRP